MVRSIKRSLGEPYFLNHGLGTRHSTGRHGKHKRSGAAQEAYRAQRGPRLCGAGTFM